MSVEVESVNNNIKVDYSLNQVKVVDNSNTVKIQNNNTYNKVKLENELSYIKVIANTTYAKIESVSKNIKVESVGPQGASGLGVPSGGTERQVLAKVNATNFNTQWRSNWYDYATNVEYTGVETAIASGDVLDCTIDGNTIYRFINSTENSNGYPIEDSFYTNFDGTNLTNLIVTRG